MNDIEMRVAILEAMGWKPYYEKGNAPWIEHPEFYSPAGKFALLEDAPDPLEDLNIMHEAEKLLDKEDKLTAYLFNLSAVVGEEPGFQTIAVSTARQRAIAFCRTLFPERFKP